MTALHYFNPGHETAVWQGTKNYTPPANVRRMTEDLSLLPLWYAAPGDFVLTACGEATGFYRQYAGQFPALPVPVLRRDLAGGAFHLPPSSAVPWGLSPQALHLFRTLGQPDLEVPDWKEEYSSLTGRQSALLCLEKLRETEPAFPLPLSPCFCRSRKELSAYVEEHAGETLLLKSPYSSSGRGLLWLPPGKWGEKEQAWAESVIQKQGTVSVEPALDNRQDFALEFFSDGKGNIRYEGLSVFGTEARGSYSGNRLGSEQARESILAAYIPLEKLAAVRHALVPVLASVYASVYTGYLGVDMLLYRHGGEYRIHPCVEINMRYTMGLVALRLSRQWLAEASAGSFHVTFDKEPGVALARHREMEARHPLAVEDGRVRCGYLSLCPVGEETRYRAFLVAEPAGGVAGDSS